MRRESRADGSLRAWGPAAAQARLLPAEQPCREDAGDHRGDRHDRQMPRFGRRTTPGVADRLQRRSERCEAANASKVSGSCSSGTNRPPSSMNGKNSSDPMPDAALAVGETAAISRATAKSAEVPSSMVITKPVTCWGGPMSKISAPPAIATPSPPRRSDEQWHKNRRYEQTDIPGHQLRIGQAQPCDARGHQALPSRMTVPPPSVSGTPSLST